MSYSFPTDAKDGDKVQLDNGIEYIYQADKERWVVNSSRDGLSGHFVKREGGDSMEGPLTMLAQDGADGRATKKIETLGVFSNSDGSALRLGTTRDRVYVGHNDTSFNGPIKVGEVQEKNAGTGIEFADRVILKTEGAEDDEAVTKKYIDDMARHLQDEIVELEEEIDAIAPSVERGKWSFTAVGTVAQSGQFTMYDADFGNGSPTGLFKSAKSIWFNELDLDGTPHSFANVKDGELLEIFIDGSPEYGLFSVVGEAHDETATGSSFWVVDVEFVRTNEASTAVGPGEICRFKIFEAPSGGEATSFVMKSGDTMSGNLNIDRSAESTETEAGLKLKGNRSNATNSSATITFENGQSLDKGYLTYRSYDGSTYFKFNRDLDLNKNDLNSVGHIGMEPDGGIGAGNNTRLTFHNSTSSGDGNALLVVPRPSDNRRGFAIRGRNADGDEEDILYTYTNPVGTPDAINYLGKMDSEKNLVNKAYVDSIVQSSSGSPVMLHSGHKVTYSYIEPGSVNEYQFFSDSYDIGSGECLYMFRAWGQKYGWTQILDYDCTENTTIELWQETSNDPLLIMRAGIREIVQSPHSKYDAKLSLDRFWTKSDYRYSKYNGYSFTIHGLVERPSSSQSGEIPAEKLSNVGESIAVPDEGEE